MMGICSNVQLVIMRTHLSSQKHIHILLLKCVESSDGVFGSSRPNWTLDQIQAHWSLGNMAQARAPEPLREVGQAS